MDKEFLFYTDDVDLAKAGVAEAGGRVSHVLTEQLVAALLPEGIGLSSVPGASPVEPERLDGMEQRVAQAWLSRLSTESVPAERETKAAAGPSVPWDTPGRLPPDGPPAEDPEEDDASIETRDPPVSTDVFIGRSGRRPRRDVR